MALRSTLLILIATYTLANPLEKQADSYTEYGIVPTFIDAAPAGFLEVVFPSGVAAQEGNELTPTEVKDLPTLNWDANPDEFYTVTFINIDAPDPENPGSRRTWEHWLVVNIPGTNLDAGETVKGFISSGPSDGSGFHRYLFLVYQQPSELVFDEPRVSSLDSSFRPNIDINGFAQKYNLGAPVAGNFYRAQYDDYVPILTEIMGW